jgi:hypothetical protein
MANLYAEYLPNIKTLTITTVLETPRNVTTALWLSNDRSKLVLEHDNHTHRITLPAKVSGQGTQHLQLPNTGELQCINRIPADPIFGQEEPNTLWSATHLDQETRVHCKNCSTLVSNGKIHVWKDLPSEAWAEMMDLWHCHKPEEPARDSDDATAQKGYAAGNKLMAQVGVGLVDAMSFLVSEHDCAVEVSFMHFFALIHTFPFFLFLPSLYSSTGFQEEVLCDYCQISIRYRFDTKTLDRKPDGRDGKQTLGLARWVVYCIHCQNAPVYHHS